MYSSEHLTGDEIPNDQLPSDDIPDLDQITLENTDLLSNNAAGSVSNLYQLCFGSDEKEIEFFCNLLCSDTKIKTLILPPLYSDQSLSAVIGMLRQNKTITHLDASHCHLNEWQTNRLINTLYNHPSISVLNLKNCTLDHCCLEDLSRLLLTNRIKKLICADSSSKLSEENIIHFLQTTMQSTLKEFEIHWSLNDPNYIKILAEELLYNTTLTTLRLPYNNIDNVGASYLAKAFQINCTLNEIDLRQNDITYAGAEILISNLEEKQKLRNRLTLNLSDNEIPKYKLNILADRCQKSNIYLIIQNNDIQFKRTKKASEILQEIQKREEEGDRWREQREREEKERWQEQIELVKTQVHGDLIIAEQAKDYWEKNLNEKMENLREIQKQPAINHSIIEEEKQRVDFQKHMEELQKIVDKKEHAEYEIQQKRLLLEKLQKEQQDPFFQKEELPWYEQREVITRERQKKSSRQRENQPRDWDDWLVRPHEVEYERSHYWQKRQAEIEQKEQHLLELAIQESLKESNRVASAKSTQNLGEDSELAQALALSLQDQKPNQVVDNALKDKVDLKLDHLDMESGAAHQIPLSPVAKKKVSFAHPDLSQFTPHKKVKLSNHGESLYKFFSANPKIQSCLEGEKKIYELETGRHLHPKKMEDIKERLKEFNPLASTSPPKKKR